MLPVDKERAYTYMVWPTTRPCHILVCPVCTVCNRTDGTDDQGTIRYSAYGIGPVIVHRCPRLLVSLELLPQNDVTHRQCVIT